MGNSPEFRQRWYNLSPCHSRSQVKNLVISRRRSYAVTGKKCTKKRDPEEVRGTAIYGLYSSTCAAVKGTVFKQFTQILRDRVYKSGSLGLEEGIIFHLN